MSDDELIRLSAREVVSRLRNREISPLDLLDAILMGLRGARPH